MFENTILDGSFGFLDFRPLGFIDQPGDRRWRNSAGDRQLAAADVVFEQQIGESFHFFGLAGLSAKGSDVGGSWCFGHLLLF